MLGNIDRARCEMGKDGSVRLRIEGWVAHRHKSIVLLQAGLVGAPMVAVERFPRPDVNKAHPQLDIIDLCGFTVALPCRKTLRGSISVFFLMTLVDGVVVAGTTAAFVPPEINDESSLEIEQAPFTDSWAEGANRLLSDALVRVSLTSNGPLTFKKVIDSPVHIVIDGRKGSGQVLRTLHSISRTNSFASGVTVLVLKDEAAQIRNAVRDVSVLNWTGPECLTSTALEIIKRERPEFLLFLTAGAEITNTTISALIAAGQQNAMAGAITPRLLYDTGLLASAGAIIWKNGKVSGYGEGEAPDDYPYNHSRSVDTFSPDCALMRSTNIESLVGFAESYTAQEYTFADFSLRLQADGFSTVYEPKAIAIIEKAPQRPETTDDQVQLQNKFRAYLSERPEFDTARQIFARDAGRRRRKVLVLCNGVAGVSGIRTDRVARLVASISSAGYDITVFPTDPSDRKSINSGEFPSSVEVVAGASILQLKQFLSDRKGYYDAIYASQPVHLRMLDQMSVDDLPIVFDPIIEILDVELSTLHQSFTGGSVIHSKAIDHSGPSTQKTARFVMLKGEPGSIYPFKSFVEIANSARITLVESHVVALELKNHGLNGIRVYESSTSKSTRDSGGVDDKIEMHFRSVLRAPRSKSKPLSIPGIFANPALLWTSPDVLDMSRLLPFALTCHSLDASSPQQLSEGYPGSTVSIIIPIHNGLAVLRQCLDSVFDNSDIGFNLILVDDASTDREVRPYLDSQLERFREHKLANRVSVVSKQIPSGFAGAVNTGLCFSSGHVILLNTDTVVPPGWLSRMISALQGDSDVATVTPLSNSGSICTLNVDSCVVPFDSPKVVDQIDAELFRHFSPIPVTIPTSVGFCMAMNRNAIEILGFLDSDCFKPMYGEENDWSSRAIAVGMRNVALPTLFVYHHDSSSFPKGPTRDDLRSLNLQKLELLHPGYCDAIDRFIATSPMSDFKVLAESIITTKVLRQKTILLIHNSELKGGSSRFLEFAFPKYDSKRTVFLLDCRESEVCLGRNSSDEVLLKFQPESMGGGLFRALMNLLAIDEIFVNQLVGGPVSRVMDWISESNRPYTFQIHDYFSACPSIMLLASNGRFCQAETRIEECRKCLAGLFPGRPEAAAIYDIEGWRSHFYEFLRNAKRLVAPSQAARKIMLKYYPELQIEVTPHSFESTIDHQYDPNVSHDSILTIAVVGAIGIFKGSDIVYELVEGLKKSKLPVRIKVIGYTDRHYDPFESPDGVLQTTGPYEPQDLARHLEESRASLVLLPSIVPETFMFVADEVLNAGYPAMAFDIGAHSERIRAVDGGWIVSEVSANALLRHLEYLVAHREEILIKSSNLANRNRRRPQGENRKSLPLYEEPVSPCR